MGLHDQTENQVKILEDELYKYLLRAIKSDPELTEILKTTLNNTAEMEAIIKLVVCVIVDKFLKELNIYLKDFRHVMESPSMKGFYS